MRVYLFSMSYGNSKHIRRQTWVNVSPLFSEAISVHHRGHDLRHHHISRIQLDCVKVNNIACTTLWRENCFISIYTYISSFLIFPDIYRSPAIFLRRCAASARHSQQSTATGPSDLGEAASFLLLLKTQSIQSILFFADKVLAVVDNN